MARVLLNQKMERVWQKVYANHAEFTNDIAAYIVRSYNSIRRHSKLGNVSPNAFENVNRYQKKTYQAVRNYLTATALTS